MRPCGNFEGAHLPVESPHQACHFAPASAWYQHPCRYSNVLSRRHHPSGPTRACATFSLADPATFPSPPPTGTLCPSHGTVSPSPSRRSYSTPSPSSTSPSAAVTSAPASTSALPSCTASSARASPPLVLDLDAPLDPDPGGSSSSAATRYARRMLQQSCSAAAIPALCADELEHVREELGDKCAARTRWRRCARFLIA